MENTMNQIKIFTIATLTSIVLAPIYTRLAAAGETDLPHGGAYIGMTAGFSSKNASIDRSPASGEFDLFKNSAGFGVVGGYNWIFSDRFILGLEADLVTAGSDATKTDVTFGAVETSGNFVGSIRARAGVSWNSALFYATAGLAFSDIATKPAGISSSNVLRTGLVFGAGIEYALNDDWSARLEGLAYNFQDEKTKFAAVERDTAMGLATIRLGVLKRF